MSLLFTPFAAGPLRLRNRIVKPATFEGMGRDGLVTPALVEHHRAVAAGGAGMTTVAYATVSADGRSYDTQVMMNARAVPGLRGLTDAVHREGAAAAIQLGHCGGFSDTSVIGGRPLAPSAQWQTYGLTMSRAMSEADIARVVGDFAAAARIAVESGFDALELHFGHGYLVSQFLCPATNRRTDRWGGSLENRARLAVEILRAVRAAVGDGAAVLAKVNLRDGFRGGLEVDEAVEVARRLEQEGATGLVLSGGFVSRTPLYMLRGDVPLKAMVAVQDRAWRKVGLQVFGRLFVQTYPFAEGFFLPEARRVRAAVKLPLQVLGGFRSRAVLDEALASGFEMVGMGRALLHDPELPRRMERGESQGSACLPCNECIPEMDRGGVRCTRPAETSPAVKSGAA